MRECLRPVYTATGWGNAAVIENGSLPGDRSIPLSHMGLLNNPLIFICILIFRKIRIMLR